MKKGIVAVLEMIMVIIALFVAFNILFPEFVYKTKWNEALLLLKGRDILLTIDRMGELYTYSLDPNASREFLDTVIPSGMIS
jgi:hypothetical protein